MFDWLKQTEHVLYFHEKLHQRIFTKAILADLK